MDTRVNLKASIKNKQAFKERFDEELFHQVDLGIKRVTKQLYIDSIIELYIQGSIDFNEVVRLDKEVDRRLNYEHLR